MTSIVRDTWPAHGLLKWYAQLGVQADVVRDEAAARGRAVHAFLEHYLLTGDLAELPPECEGFGRAAIEFLWDTDPKALAVELLVSIPELRYAGRLDAIAEISGVPTLLDFKTGTVRSEAHVQTTAYRIANERCNGPAIEQTVIVDLDADGTYRLVEGFDVPKLWSACRSFYFEKQRFEDEAGDGA